MQEQINEIIKKNLPQEVGEVLQKRLLELEKIEKDFDTIQKNLSYETKVTNETLMKCRNLEVEVEKAGNLDKREEQVSIRERGQEVYELRTQLDAANKTNSDINGFIGLLMRNTIYRENLLKSHIPETSYDSNNNCITKQIETGHDKTNNQE